MAIIIDEPSDEPEGAEKPIFGEWLKAEMDRQGVTIPGLAERAGITYTAIWNIIKGNTVSPRDETRNKLASALRAEIPATVEAEVEQQSAAIPGYEWSDFTPSDLETVPEKAGVYVLYDITGRPVYVGKSKTNARTRVKDDQTRFWFRPPLVVRGAFLTIPDADTCAKVEMILLKFLGQYALFNIKGVGRDVDE